MKKFMSALMVASVLGSVAYVPKSQAGMTFMLMAGATAVTTNLNNGLSDQSRKQTAGAGIGLIVSGMAMWMFSGGLMATPAGPVLLILSEDGNISKTDLEAKLADQFPFILDRDVISNMAIKIKSKVKTQKPDAEGKILVSLSEEEVKELLSPIEDELNEEEINKVVQTLK